LHTGYDGRLNLIFFCCISITPKLKSILAATDLPNSEAKVSIDSLAKSGSTLAAFAISRYEMIVSAGVYDGGSFELS
jgi:hypothetical protein